MSAVQNVLVVGAGAAGSAVAIALARAGVRVDLIDAAASVNALGSGITLQGNALRELRALGVWEACREQGYAFEGLGLRAPDPAGTLIAEIPELRTGGEDLPATMGMYRPALAQILIDRAVEVGAQVRFATRYTAFLQDEAGVHVDFADGTIGATTCSSAPTASTPRPVAASASTSSRAASDWASGAASARARSR